MTRSGPNLEEIRTLAKRLRGRILQTPVIRCPAIEAQLGNGTRVHAKLEFLQHTGTFKARGALATVSGLDADELQRGVTAVSAGNHAIATAFAAQALGTTAKVVMISSANQSRVRACETYGAELVFEDDIHKAFDVARSIQEEEGRVFVHPFEGPAIALGTGTLGLEMCKQVPDFDAVVIPVGGGGLIAGAANAIRQQMPTAEIIGVEPDGADTMHRSFASGKPEGIEAVTTIADSLGAPFAMPYSYALTRANVDRLALVDDLALRRVMGFLFTAMRVAVEPACVASTAALLGPLRSSLRGKRVLLLMCGSNIDWATFYRHAIFDDVA
tara:strand:- start:1531 stop:2514 length:984 start_codon:yes stop_codon:yes gene_type:complete